MVARRTHYDRTSTHRLPGLTSALRAWFLTWRLLLTQALLLPVRAARQAHYRPRPSLVVSYLRGPERAMHSAADAPVRLAALGVRAFIAGALGLVVVTGMTGGDIAVATTRALTAGVWAIARLGIMLFFTKGDRTVKAAVVTGWAAGLLPYVLGATMGLRTVAFLISAIYTDAALNGVGIPAERSRSLVARAFGAQGLVVGASWAVRALLAGLIALGASL